MYTRNTRVALTLKLTSIFKHTETILPKKNYISSMVYLLYTMACMFPQCPHCEKYLIFMEITLHVLHL